MPLNRSFFAGGNTCYGFYSFYDNILPINQGKKFIIKGGPGSGKSSLMKSIAQKMINKGSNVEFFWCSSDDESLDGILIDNCVAFVDGTAPHVADPYYPGIYDEIINLGQYWDTKKLLVSQNDIIKLTQQNSACFRHAYRYLKAAHLYYQEWQSYYAAAVDQKAVNRNLLSLAEDFLASAPSSESSRRHFFAAAFTPTGITCTLDKLIAQDYEIFAIKNSLGTGINNIFKHVLHLANYSNLDIEVIHSPFDPEEIDMIIIPANKSILIDLSGYIVNYEKYLPHKNWRRLLDAEQFLQADRLDPAAKYIANAQNYFRDAIQEALNFIKMAKYYHDKLEGLYKPAMNFTALDELSDYLVNTTLSLLPSEEQ